MLWVAGTIITMTTRTNITIMDDFAALARLLTFSSPAFPTGGFAYSHGIEWAVEAGDVRDEVSLRDWLKTLLCHGAGWSDAILLRHAFRVFGDAVAVAALAETAAALAPGRELQLETLAQGAAFSASAGVWCEIPVVAYPVAYGVFAARQGVGEDASCIGFLSAWLGNLVSAGVRLVPLGQQAGLRVLRALEPSLRDVSAQSADATLDDLGTACFRADISAMRHETQYSRMFRS
jgi:urease accessory protein